MRLPSTALRTVIVLAVFSIALSIVYVVGDKVLSLPFRHTNDLLHQNNAPLTLDVLIPAGIYIDPKTSIKEVLQLRFRGPQSRIGSFLVKISHTIPTRYRMLSAGILYFFWVTVCLAFFRIVTWMRYATALAAAFLAGATLYYFMPDLEVGRMDDTIFGLWAICFAIALRWCRKKPRDG